MEQQTSVEAKKGPMLTCLISFQLSKEHAKAKNAKETRFSKIPTYTTTVSYVRT